MPAFCDTLSGQVEHPTLGIIAGEAGHVSGDLPELPVEALDNIGRVYDLPDLGWIFIKSTQNRQFSSQLLT